MPDLDELLDVDARAWQADIDRRTRRFVEPAPRRARVVVWSAAAVAAVTVGSVAIAWSIAGDTTGTHDAQTHGSTASCAGPQLSVTPRVVAPGATVTVRGEWFALDCNDTGGTETIPPMVDVPILLVDGGSVQRLATAHPSGERYSFEVTVRIPTDAEPGPALINYTAQRFRSPLSHNAIRITG